MHAALPWGGGWQLMQQGSCPCCAVPQAATYFCAAPLLLALEPHLFGNSCGSITLASTKFVGLVLTLSQLRFGCRC